jgi:tRNA(Ile)-lysidine synthase
MSHALEHRVLDVLKDSAAPRGRWLLAVSGGVDSMVLADVLWRWRRYLKIEIVVAHVHHGDAHNSEYRDRARAGVRAWCKQHRVRFVHNVRAPSLKNSETELREYRRLCLRRWRRELECECIVFAHHRDDLLETQILRLIRGSGPGGMRAMDVLKASRLRPLLNFARAELLEYARARKLEWCEDPTNADAAEALRNWVRHEWLPLLEQRQPGASKSLARSLSLLAQDSPGLPLNSFVGLRRKLLGQVSPPQRRTVVANYLRALGLQGYGRAHIEEIVKRLRDRRREFEFTVCGCVFRVTPDLVWASSERASRV